MHKCPENSAQQNLTNFKTALNSLFSLKKSIFPLLTQLPIRILTLLSILYIFTISSSVLTNYFSQRNYFSADSGRAERREKATALPEKSTKPLI